MMPLECRHCGEVLTNSAQTGAYLGDTEGTIVGCFCSLCWEYLDANSRGIFLPSGQGWSPRKEAALGSAPCAGTMWRRTVPRCGPGWCP